MLLIRLQFDNIDKIVAWFKTEELVQEYAKEAAYVISLQYTLDQSYVTTLNEELALIEELANKVTATLFATELYRLCFV